MAKLIGSYLSALEPSLLLAEERTKEFGLLDVEILSHEPTVHKYLFIGTSRDNGSISPTVGLIDDETFQRIGKHLRVEHEQDNSAQ